eukprot:CAMPEP_0119012016 /NCGR_PEP_ID=MMETSP1176-20130426/6027_1 /TAXON_ID=265551 /ORGANISM="Synedropsis recta cf, Strain CCMP1620" /LENGTH=384 /DNA_ID=CAMNT_0006964911 /DNA_START=135 /DNA_END=1286 /DNA_ORIENTATION=+
MPLRIRMSLLLAYCLLLLLLLAATTIATIATAATLPSRRVVTRRTLFTPSNNKKKNKSKGTQFTWRRPTSTSSQLFASSSTTPFNHATAGMTNPSLHIAVDNQVVMHVLGSSSSSSSSSSSKSDSQVQDETSPQEQHQKEDAWWPEGMTTTTTTNAAAGWRVKEYRRTVGWGTNCYETVREKVLAWEFDANHQGILALDDQDKSSLTTATTATTTPTRQSKNRATIRHNNKIDNNPSPWHHSTTNAAALGGDRPRLVTYTKSFLGFWCVSPIRVVYDWVDQRGPSTTYTSTAYATLQNHGLVGEERVTVALRDNDSRRVDVQIISYSKASHHWWAQVAFGIGLMQKMQDRFFSNQMQWLQTVAEASSSTATTAEQQPQQQPQPQ